MSTKDPATATLLPFKVRALPLETQAVIDALEAEIAELRAGKTTADAMVMVFDNGDALHITYANMSIIEVIGMLHTAATRMAMD